MSIDKHDEFYYLKFIADLRQISDINKYKNIEDALCNCIWTNDINNITKCVVNFRMSATGENNIYLLLACKYGKIFSFKRLLILSNIDLNKIPATRHPFYMACIFGQIKIVEYLINERKFNPAKYRNLALILSLLTDNYSMAKYLLKNDKVIVGIKNYDVICFACSGSIECVKNAFKLTNRFIPKITPSELDKTNCIMDIGIPGIKHEFTGGISNIIEYASYLRKWNMVSYLATRIKPTTNNILHAIFAGKIQIIKDILLKYPNLNKDYLLCYACRGAKSEIMKYFLSMYSIRIYDDICLTLMIENERCEYLFEEEKIDSIKYFVTYKILIKYLMNRNDSVLKKLIEYEYLDVEKYKKELYYYCVKYNNISLMKLVMKHSIIDKKHYFDICYICENEMLDVINKQYNM